MTISLSKNILAKFENSLTRSILEYELISIASGADLTSFTKSHAEADKKVLLHSYQSTFRGCNKLEVIALPGFVDFSDETILADFQAKAKWHAVKSLDHPLMRLAYHLLSLVRGHFHKLGKTYVPFILCQVYFELQEKALMEKLLQIAASQQQQCQVHSSGSTIKAMILAKWLPYLIHWS